MPQLQPSFLDDVRVSGDGVVPPRTLGLSVLALSVAGLGVWLQTPGEVRHVELLCVLALVPPFLLAYHRGWRRPTVVLVAGMAVLTGAAVGSTLVAGGAWLDGWPIVGATAGLVAVSLGWGYSRTLLRPAGGDLGRYAERLRRLTEGTRAIQGRVTLDERLEAVVEHARRVMEASRAEIVLVDDLEADRERIQCGDGVGDEAAGTPPARRVLSAPIRERGGEEIGRLEVTRRAGDGEPFDRADAALLGQIAELASTGIQSARLYEELRTSEERYRTMADDVIDGSGVGVLVVTPGGRVEWTSRAFEEFFGLRRGEALGERHERLFRSRIEPLVHDGRAFREAVLEARERNVEHFRIECRVTASRDGRRPERWLEHMSSPITTGLYAGGRVEHYADVTERKRAEQALAHAAGHDALTGLPNRTLFLDRVERLLEHVERTPDHRFALLFLDLDRFKLVNDSFGHQTGDRLLQAVATRLRGCLRSADTVARLGGDEFAIVLHEITEDADAVRLARRIRSALESPFGVGGHTVHVTASIGIALSEARYADPEAMLRDADTAMYQAKEESDGHRLFDESMHARVVEELDLETGLRYAIERGELRLEYQPLFRLQDGTMEGVEALLRWTHPSRGEIPPSRFVPIAEETGQIGRIGEWALQEGISALAGWSRRHAAAGELFLAVNLSPRQLLDEELGECVTTMLADADLEPSRLVLEVRERDVAAGHARLRDRMAALRGRKLRIALDDFGAGSSSLAALGRIPADFLKLDPSCTEAGPARSPLLEAVSSLTRSLGLTLVAEGVETDGYLEDLKRVGCRLGQGYALARPMSEHALDRRLDEADGERGGKRVLELIS